MGSVKGYYRRDGSYVRSHVRGGGYSVFDIVGGIFTGIWNAGMAALRGIEWVCKIASKKRKGPNSNIEDPNNLIPHPIIRTYALLRKMPELLGFDLRDVTADKMVARELDLLKKLDGVKYSGVAYVQGEHIVAIQSGDCFYGTPYWEVNILFQKTNVQFLKELLDKCLTVFGKAKGPIGVGNLTGLDVQLMERNSTWIIKTWENTNYMQGTNYLKKCRLSIYTIDHGAAICMNYRINI